MSKEHQKKSEKNNGQRKKNTKTEKKKNGSETTGKQGEKKSKDKETERENGKEGEIVPDLDLRGSGPSDVSIS